jgi:hypothetical protein
MKQPDTLPGGPLVQVLLPPEPRRYPGQRWLKMTARAAHVVLAGIYLGALVFRIEPAAAEPWLRAALLSGVLMACLDLCESGAFLLQVRGLVVVGKLLLLALLPSLGAAGVWAVAAVALLSVISSHAPASVRYHLIWGRGRIRAAETPG